MFATRNISAQKTMFQYVIGNLSPEFAVEVRDVLISPPSSQPYDVLKAALTQRTKESEQKRLRQLMTAAELGDRQPSQLLRRMQQLLDGKQLDEALFRQLFVQRLPQNSQVVLASVPSGSSLDDLAALADRIVDVTGESTTANIHAVQLNAIVEMQRQITALTEAVQSMATQDRRQRRTYSRTRSPSPAPARERSFSTSSGQHDTCWFRRKFGASARNCRKPCSWQENKKAGMMYGVPVRRLSSGGSTSVQCQASGS